MTMKATTKTGKNQKVIRKVREISVEAIQAISFSLKTLSVTFCTYSLSQWELSTLG